MLYGMTAFSSFVLPYYDSFMPLAVSVAVLSLVAYVGACSWALFGAVFRRFLQSHHAAANAVMALLLVWCASPCMFKGPSWVQSVFLGLPTFLHSAIQ